MLGGPASAWLRQRTPIRRLVAWVLAVAGPALLTLGALPWRSSLVLGGFLFSALLVVIMVALIGGPPPALAAVVLSVLARVFLFAAPFEDRRADLQPNFISLAAFTVAGAAAAILIGKLAQLAEEQSSSQRIEAALRRAATLVARASPAEELFAAVTEEVGQVLPVDFARLARYEPGDSVTIVAAWNRTGADFPVGSRWPLAGENVSALVLRTGCPARIDDFAGAPGALSAKSRELGVRGVAGAPVIAEGRVWGVMLAGTRLKRALPPAIEASLASFTDLLATAISNAASRGALTRLAQEQAALQRVATLVAGGAPPDELFAAVSGEVGRLLQAGQTAMIRYEPDGTAARAAAWSAAGGAVVPAWRERVGGRNLTTVVWQTGRPARVGSYADASGAAGAVARKAGFRSAVGTPIIVQGRLWGVMIAGSVTEQPLGPDTEARLASFTELVVTAISNAENLAELTASRARVVATADETRRRIERDLHDGAQQRLVSLGLALRAAQTEIPPQHARLDRELGRVADGLASVLDDLQEMARGIHPAILAQGGLGPALKTLARRCALPVVLDVRAVDRLPEQVEVAAYYVVSEALTNAVKHARASLIHVEADTLEDALQLRVRDDGAGGADPVVGSGLLGLKDRVEALGGTITVDSPASAGTSLHARLPLAG